MKKILLLMAVFALGFLGASAQSTSTTDTVCAGSSGVSYWFAGRTGSTYAWTVNGGSQASGGTTDSITVDFLSTTGVDTITVVETDSNGCVGDPVKLAVVRMPNPTATIAGSTSLCFADSTTLTVTLTGTSPWDLTYTDGTTPTTVNITSSPFVFNTGSLTSTTTYTLQNVVDKIGCSTTLSGSSSVSPVTVFPKVVTPAIFHF